MKFVFVFEFVRTQARTDFKFRDSWTATSFLRFFYSVHIYVMRKYTRKKKYGRYSDTTTKKT